jgi:hypothetical protein
VAVRKNGAAGGSNTTTVTTGNSGGDSGDAWNQVDISATAALTFDNTKGRGNLGYKMSTGGTAGNSDVGWTGLSMTTTVFSRFYMYCTANPPANHRIWSCAPAAGTHASIQMLTGGTLRWVQGGGGTLTATTATVTLNQWVRIEVSAVCTATGTLTLRLYNNADSTTITETSTGANSGGGTTITRVFFGISGTAVTNTGPLWQDEMEANDTGFPGPVETLDERTIPYITRQAVPRAAVR